MSTAAATERRLVEHVDRLAQEHPPIDLDSVDYAVRRPDLLAARYGHVLDYMARTWRASSSRSTATCSS